MSYDRYHDFNRICKLTGLDPNGDIDRETVWRTSADRIEKLQAEVARLEKSKARLNAQLDDMISVGGR